jgi:hypothetical protein
LRAANEDRAGEGVNASAIDSGKLLEQGTGMHLSAGGLDAPEVDGVAGIDLKARRQSAIPARVR